MTLIDEVREAREGATPGPWELCAHLADPFVDGRCGCGYRGVIYGPDNDVARAICQPGHEPAPQGQEGTGPARYDRPTELANARLIALAPRMADALLAAVELARLAEEAKERGYIEGVRHRMNAALTAFREATK